MLCLGRIPSAGDHFHCFGWRFEVVDMDRLRVDKVLAIFQGLITGHFFRSDENSMIR
jgi:CBS domain containing-hemolysin-like protein